MPESESITVVCGQELNPVFIVAENGLAL